MRTIVAAAVLALLAVSGWLWYQVRDAYDLWTSYVVQTEQSRLVEARRVEAMLYENRVDDALTHLQRNRDVFVLQLASTRSAIDMTSWQMSRNQYTIDRVESSLREEAEYRLTFGDSNGRLAEQVKIVLDEFKQ